MLSSNYTDVNVSHFLPFLPVISGSLLTRSRSHVTHVSQLQSVSKKVTGWFHDFAFYLLVDFIV